MDDAQRAPPPTRKLVRVLLVFGSSCRKVTNSLFLPGNARYASVTCHTVRRKRQQHLSVKAAPKREHRWLTQSTGRLWVIRRLIAKTGAVPDYISHERAQRPEKLSKKGQKSKNKLGQNGGRRHPSRALLFFGPSWARDARGCGKLRIPPRYFRWHS